MATLLIVEDDHKTNDAICEYLKPTGHSLIPAYDGSEALQLFRETASTLLCWTLCCPTSAAYPFCMRYGGPVQHPF